jgi:hypothetical protein
MLSILIPRVKLINRLVNYLDAEENAGMPGKAKRVTAAFTQPTEKTRVEGL